MKMKETGFSETSLNF